MAHLGNETKVSDLKVGEQQLVETPSRLMTMVLDHETWFNEPGVGSQYEDAENPSVYEQFLGKLSLFCYGGFLLKTFSSTVTTNSIGV